MRIFSLFFSDLKSFDQVLQDLPGHLLTLKDILTPNYDERNTCGRQRIFQLDKQSLLEAIYKSLDNYLDGLYSRTRNNSKSSLPRSPAFETMSNGLLKKIKALMKSIKSQYHSILKDYEINQEQLLSSQVLLFIDKQ